MASLSATTFTDNGKVDWRFADTATDQRGNQRVELDIDVNFRNADGQHCAARLSNIAPEGIQVRCNFATAKVLHPGAGKICERNAPIVQTVLALPVAAEFETLSVCARLAYATTLADEPLCVLGLEFVDPRPTASRVLERYFASQAFSH